MQRYGLHVLYDDVMKRRMVAFRFLFTKRSRFSKSL